MKCLVNIGITASMVACGVCLCTFGSPATTNKVAGASIAVGVKESSATGAKAAAEKGGAEAQFRYAQMLRDGRGVAKNVREAAKWTRKAAAVGHVAALCRMTHMNA